MTQTLKVKFQNGAFHPVEDVPPAIPEGQDALVTVEMSEVETEAAPQPKPRIAGLHAGLVGWDPTFDDDLPDSFWLGEE